MPAVFPNLAGRTLEVQRVKAALFSSAKGHQPALAARYLVRQQHTLGGLPFVIERVKW
jgi:hypothetical protein